MNVWKLSQSKFEHSTSFTWGKIYSDPLDASEEMLEQYSARHSLYKDDVIIAEYHPATGANLVLKDGRRWTWTIDMLEMSV